MIHIQNPKDKDSYPYNEPHLQLNLWTLVWILRFDSCFIKLYESSDSFELK